MFNVTHLQFFITSIFANIVIPPSVIHCNIECLMVGYEFSSLLLLFALEKVGLTKNLRQKIPFYQLHTFNNIIRTTSPWIFYSGQNYRFAINKHNLAKRQLTLFDESL